MEPLFWVCIFTITAAVLSFFFARWLHSDDGQEACKKQLDSVRRVRFLEGGVVAEAHPGEVFSYSGISVPKEMLHALNGSSLAAMDCPAPKVYECGPVKQPLQFGGFTELPGRSIAWLNKKCNYCGRPRTTNTNCPHCGGYDK